jgi:hypothetical protein
MLLRPPKFPTEPFTPPPKYPLDSPGVFDPTPRRMTLGTSGRTFSCRSRARVACTSACWDASSGRLVRATGIRSSTGQAGLMSSTRRSGSSAGTTTVVGSSRRSRTKSALATCQRS